MTDFTVNVISENDEKRVPVALAGQIMVDMQDLLTHVGDYLVSREMCLQNIVSKELSEKFTLYIDGSGNVGMNTSSDLPETKGYGNLVDDAVKLTETILDTMGAGTGSYWMEDNFPVAIYRDLIIYDLIGIQQDLVEHPGFALMYGPADKMKRFGSVDVEKLSAFIEQKRFVAYGAAIGTVEESPSRSKRMPVFMNDAGTARLGFNDDSVKDSALSMIGKGPVLVSGRLSFDENGSLMSIDDVKSVTASSEVKFRRMIADNGDILLNEPVTVRVRFSNGKWNLSNEELCIDVSDSFWDNAVKKFHNYFVFLWLEYAAKDESELDEEGKELKSALLKLCA